MRWNETSYSAQSLYISILTLVDDYGRFEAHPAIVHAECRGLREQVGNVLANDNDLPDNARADDSSLLANDSNHAVNRGQTTADLIELERRGLIQVYKVDGVLYLQMTRWQERIRQKGPRYPAPPVKLPANDSGVPDKPPANDSEVPDNCPPPVPVPAPAPVPPASVGVDDDVQYAEAKRVVIEIGRNYFTERIVNWGEMRQYDQWLADALPIPREQFEAMRWFYALPRDHEIFTDFKHPAKTRRRYSFSAFLENLKSECQKAWEIRQKYEISNVGDIDAIPE